jgi:cell migration-inducing and hyaluronan-binding protein
VLGSNVVIPSGTKVIYDVNTTGITYSGVTVSGGAELIFDGTQNVWMESYYINVEYNATFRIGSSSCYYPTKATIMLVGPWDNTTMVVPHVGTKNVIVQGLLEWYGTPPQPTWTNIVSTVYPNATNITVQAALSNWKVGDSIVLASTDYYQDLTEQFTITAISGSVITLNSTVKYMHYGAEYEYAEAGHISRNIVVMGDVQSDTMGFGGHCIVIANGIAHVYGVEFTRMGQRGILARYPFHFHYMGDQIGKGHFVEECAFHHNYQRCLTVHATSGVFVQNNVGFNVTGHCYFLEEVYLIFS